MRTYIAPPPTPERSNKPVVELRGRKLTGMLSLLHGSLSSPSGLKIVSLFKVPRMPLVYIVAQLGVQHISALKCGWLFPGTV